MILVMVVEGKSSLPPHRPFDVLGGVRRLLHRGGGDPWDRLAVLFEARQIAHDVHVVPPRNRQVRVHADPPRPVERHSQGASQGEAATPAAQRTVRASIRSGPTVTPRDRCS